MQRFTMTLFCAAFVVPDTKKRSVTPLILFNTLQEDFSIVLLS